MADLNLIPDPGLVRVYENMVRILAWSKDVGVDDGEL